MGIYRCNKCGHLAEHAWQPHMAEVACPKCQAPNKVYDTLFFVQKLLERYFAVNRELRALKAQEQETPEDKNQSSQQTEQEQNNLLVGVNLAATDVLATQEQHEPLKQWFIKQNIVPTFDFSAVDMSGYFDEAASEIGGKYHITKDILGRIGWAYRNNHTGINLDIGKMAQKRCATDQQYVPPVLQPYIVCQIFLPKAGKSYPAESAKSRSHQAFFQRRLVGVVCLGQNVGRSQTARQGIRFFLRPQCENQIQ